MRYCLFRLLSGNQPTTPMFCDCILHRHEFAHPSAENRSPYFLEFRLTNDEGGRATCANRPMADNEVCANIPYLPTCTLTHSPSFVKTLTPRWVRHATPFSSWRMPCC